MEKISKIKLIIKYNVIYSRCFKILPSSLKRFVLRQLGAEVDQSCQFGRNVLIGGDIQKISIGKNVYIGDNCIIRIHQMHTKMIIKDEVIIKENTNISYRHTPEMPSEIVIGQRTTIGANVDFDTTYGLTIGENVIFSNWVAIITHDHGFKRDEIINKQPIVPKYNTVIGDDVFCGFRSIVIGGISIGDGVVIGAQSVVTKNVEPYSIVVGAPAKKVGERI